MSYIEKWTKIQKIRNILNNNLSEVLILGADNGDGEYVVSKALIESDGITLQKIEEQSLDATASKSMYAIAAPLHNGETVIGKNAGTNPDNIVTNYKKLGDMGEMIVAVGENHYCYNTIMSQAFAALVRAYLVQNPQDIKDKRAVFLFVGRPSSSSWESYEETYISILEAEITQMKNQLSQKKGWEFIANVDFYLLPVSEARAAMAYEYKVKDNPLKKCTDKIIAILDGGSSTFDTVIMKCGRILAEYSRQLGAGMLDKNLYDIALYGGAEEAQKVSWADRRKHTAKLSKQDTDNRLIEGLDLMNIRVSREAHYGSDGTQKTQQAAYLSNGTICLITQTTMSNAIHNLPVAVTASYPQDQMDEFHCAEDYEYVSFYAALLDFLKGTKARCKNIHIDEIIVTGGATVMPFVTEALHEVFKPAENNIQVEEDNTVNRKYSVAMGAAYIGYLELFKQLLVEEFLDDIIKTILERDKIKNCIVSKTAEELRNDLYECYMIPWQNDPAQSTLNHLLNRDTYYMRETWDTCFKKGVNLYLNTDFTPKMRSFLEDKAKKILGDKINSYSSSLKISAAPSGFSLTFHFSECFRKSGVFGFSRVKPNAKLDYSKKRNICQNFMNTSYAIEEFSKDIRAQMDRYMNETVDILTSSIKEELSRFIAEIDSYLISNDFNTN